jgi:hypothetical protein
LYYPDSRRHDLKAIVAYGAYKRSFGAGEQQPSGAARLKADAISTEAQEVEEWEDEGGDTARAIAARLGSLEVSACYATRGVRMAARVDERVGCV